MTGDASFWHAYAIKNNIRSTDNPAIAAARAFSVYERKDAVIAWPNGRETIFRDGYRI